MSDEEGCWVQPTKDAILITRDQGQEALRRIHVLVAVFRVGRFSDWASIMVNSYSIRSGRVGVYDVRKGLASLSLRKDERAKVEEIWRLMRAIGEI